MPHIVQISFFMDPQKRDPDSLLRDWKTLRNVAYAASDPETRVTVIQASHTKALISDRGVDFHFQPFGFAAPHQHRVQFFRLAGSLQADMFHVHGLGFPRETEQLATACPKLPILAQDHADRPPVFLRRMQFRRGYASLRGVTFTGLAKAQPYVEQKLFPPGIRIFDIPESSSHFSPGDPDNARRNSGLSGSPCIVWIGHLNANKDPLSVIDGVEQAMQWLPNLHLWLAFRTAPLLNKVQERIRRSPALASHIHLLGPVANDRLELLLRAADLFVVGSHSEGSGYALLEALSCGVPPVVTDIPSFRTLTMDGRIGRLWSCGEPEQLANALRAIWSEPQQALREAVRSHFIRQLSFPAVGAALRSAYREILVAP